MTTEPPVTIGRPVSRRAERNFHDRVVQICADYKAIDKHLIANHNGEFSEVCEAFKLAHENLCAADLDFEHLSAERLIKVCAAHCTALNEFIRTFDFKMRVHGLVAVACVALAVASELVDYKYGVGPGILVCLAFSLLGAYAALEWKSQYESTFRYAYSLQAQMKRDLGLAIKVIEDDMNPHH